MKSVLKAIAYTLLTLTFWGLILVTFAAGGTP